MTKANATILTLALMSAGLAFAAGGESAGRDARGISVYGTVSAEAIAGIGSRDLGTNGYESELRLVLEAEDGDLSFRAEGGFTFSYGISSNAALAFESGLVPTPAESDLPPDTDIHRDSFVDQAWARAVLGDLEVRVGIVPVSWGSAYLYNPTSRTAEAEFPGEDIDRVRGKPGAFISMALPAGFAVETYVLAQGRSPDGVPEARELTADRIPLGCRLVIRSDRFDAAASWIRERANGNEKAESYAGFDATLVAGAFTLYAESAIPVGEPARWLELSAGLAWDVSARGMTVRAEYVRLGKGSPDGAYDPARILSGETALLARDYLFAGAEIEDGENARWTVEAGTLINLNDGSMAMTARCAWKPRTTLEIAAFVRYFADALGGSDAGAEFGGGIDAGPGIEFNPYRSVAGLSAAWSF